MSDILIIAPAWPGGVTDGGNVLGSVPVDGIFFAAGMWFTLVWLLAWRTTTN